MKVIQLDKITKDYGQHKGVFDLSFSINKGEIFGFLGPNGAGKTTAIRNLMGFITPDTGSCSIAGLDPQNDAAKIQETLGYLPGEIAFMDEMNGLEFIKFIADMKGLKDLSKAHELMKRFELDPSGRIKKMSKGMKQKIGIICAFMHDPEILILDEPTSGLDPLMQNTFVELLLEERARGKTILMSSHMFEEVEKTCDRVAIIKDGVLAIVKDIHEIKEEQKQTYTISFKNKSDAKKFANEKLDIEDVQGNNVVVNIQNNMDELIRILTKYPILKIRLETLNLEKLFMHYYGGTHHA